MKIGLTLPQAATGDGTSRRYREIRDAALRAETDGFDPVWVMDHLLFPWEENPTSGVWEGMTLLAALAEATERVELGALVICTAFRNPALLAKMTTALDEISDGRFVFGWVPAGTSRSLTPSAIRMTTSRVGSRKPWQSSCRCSAKEGWTLPARSSVRQTVSTNQGDRVPQGRPF